MKRKTESCRGGRVARPLATAIALALAAPAAVLAEPLLQVPLTRGADMRPYSQDYFEAGVGYVDNGSFKFGEFTGLKDDSAFFVGNANVRRRFGDGRDYLNGFAYDVGLPKRDLGIEYGRQGAFKLFAAYQSIDRYQFEDAKFIHEGLGGNLLTLPAGFQGINGQPPANVARINPFLHGFDVKQERDIFRVGGSVDIGSGWSAEVKYRQDDRDGTRLIGSVMGNSGGNPRAALLPYGLDDRTQQVDAMLKWSSKDVQANVSYWYSRYDNDASSLTWQNPYQIINGWVGNSGFPTGYGRLELMPSNDFHQVQGALNWAINPTTQFAATAAYSVMRQDEEFLPYTINTAAQTPGTTLSVPNPLPRSSLDGEIENILVDLRLTARPVRGLSLKANYRFLKHDNNTPEDVYGYVGGDTTNQDPIIADTVNSTRIRRNLAPGQTEHKFKIDADYQIARGLLLRGWYERRDVDYEPAHDELRSETTNDQLAVELRKVMSESFTGSLRYMYDQREGSDYSLSRPYAASYTSAVVTANPIPDNVPTLRHFFFADFERDTLRATGSFSPMERATIDFRADWYQTRYKGPDCGGPNDQVSPTLVFPPECLGRTKAKGESYTVDGSFVPADGWNAFAFYTYSRFATDQASRSWGGANLANNTARNWFADLEYFDHTVGLGLRFQPATARWDAGMQYVYSDGTGKTSLASGPGLTFTPVPDIRTKLHSFQLFGRYQHSKNIGFRANYWYERLRTDDWAFDNATPTSSNNVLLTGVSSPNYGAHVFAISFIYSNW
ncbi:MAG: MtrB/PioB family decaheme-associated outer membrane protein [Burkholderiales bacterium]|nr:MtrB/PioB family decaheme-associated outer membrane protein [Burkholderiales bacterium]